MNDRSVKPTLPKVSLADLVLGFSKIAVASFGGGLSAWSRVVIVKQRRWMSDEEFLSALTFCRVLPGANQINMAIYVGTRLRGFPGVLSALLGLLALPTCIVAAMGIVYFHYREVPALSSALRGVTAASVGMTLAMGFQVGARYLTQGIALGFILAAFLAAGGIAVAASTNASRTDAAEHVLLLAAQIAYEQGGLCAMNSLLALVVIFVPLSLMAIGGTNTVIPEMHLQVVRTEHWMSDREFADIFAIAQSAPGPSTLIVTLIGYKVAGLLGAAVATIATIALPSILIYILTQFWERGRDSKLRLAVEQGLTPITVGLVFASGLVVARAADHGVVDYVATAVATLLFVRTKINPLLIIPIFGVLGILGLL